MPLLPTVMTTHWGIEVERGNVPGFTFIHKFGEAADIDTADGFADIWDGATDTISGFTKTPSYTYSSTADIDSIVSSNASDTTALTLLGLDTNFALVEQTKNLNGQTRVPLDTALVRLFRMENTGAVPFVGNVFGYVDGTLTAGVPNTEADVRAIIQIGNEQTLMAIYTVPAGITGFMLQWYASASKKKDQLSDIELLFRPSGGVFQLKHVSSLAATGSSKVWHEYSIPLVLSAKTDVALRADASKDNGAVSGGYDIVLVDD